MTVATKELVKYGLNVPMMLGKNYITAKLEAKFPHRTLCVHCVKVWRNERGDYQLEFHQHYYDLIFQLKPGVFWETQSEEWWEKLCVFEPRRSSVP